MKKTLLTLIAVLAMPAAAFAATKEIEVGDNFFEPNKAAGSIGDGLHWGWATQNQHSVRQDDGLFYSGSPQATGELTVTPSAGTFGYHCELHGAADGQGMSGTLKVRPQVAASKGKKVEIVWATGETDTGSRFDVRRQKGKGKKRTVLKKTRDERAAFKLKKGTRYKFQVRSRQGRKKSGWSPKLKVKG